MKILKYLIIVSCIQLYISSCTKNDPQFIESELLVYFDDFEIEAELHGLKIDISEIDIDAYIENIETNGTLGQCKSYSDGSQKVIIDDNYWNKITDLEKEYIVFHELGHCLLDREHNNEKDENGTCVSIMQSGINECKSTYNKTNRELLLAELFAN